MSSFENHIETLARAKRWTYRAARASATEPAAWAAIALSAHGRRDAALRAATWLADLQQDDGSVGISDDDSEPRWPTSLAMLAWCAVNGAGGDKAPRERHFKKQTELAVTWSLAASGKTAPRSTHVGHDTELTGWTWAADTHSWLEPTCLFVLGLRAAGYGEHARVREGVRLIVDRLLPDGGANYGNTIVLGQPLVPHVQPTGLAMLALESEDISDDRIEKSLEYLERTIGPDTSPTSLSFACLGLGAHGRRPVACDAWISSGLEDPRRSPLATYEQALLLLAAGSRNLGRLSLEAGR